MTGAIGRPVTGPRFTLHDDALHPDQLAIPFDPEGTPKRRVTLVERGIAKGPVYDRWSAKAAATDPTGHAADPGRYGHGGHAGNLVMSGGTATRDQLIGSVTRGILITRFHYTNTPDPKRATMTGTTRDGTFLIEDGKLTRGVRNLRFNQSLVDALETCAFSNDQQRTGGYSYALVAPAVKFDRFTFASTTDY